MAVRLPLSTLLSQVLVAFTIELDNEFERQMPHRTAAMKRGDAPRGAPWLVSMVMWSNLLQYVGEEGVTIRELQSRAGITTPSLAGMERWGYITVGPDPAAGGTKPRRADWMVRLTSQGRKAQEVWRPLFDVFEKRWEARFGADSIGRLRESLMPLADAELPEYLPVLGFGMFAEELVQRGRRPVPAGAAPQLPALLSRVLLAFTIDFERESTVSLPMSANVMRVIDDGGVAMKDLPLLSGVSKEAIGMMSGFLEKGGFVVVEPDESNLRVKLIRATEKGRIAKRVYQERLRTVEEQWQENHGADNIRGLRESLEKLVGESDSGASPLFAGLKPNPDGWRASVRAPRVLPHYPMVLHRGGYPDGS